MDVSNRALQFGRAYIELRTNRHRQTYSGYPFVLKELQIINDRDPRVMARTKAGKGYCQIGTSNLLKGDVTQGFLAGPAKPDEPAHLLTLSHARKLLATLTFSPGNLPDADVRLIRENWNAIKSYLVQCQPGKIFRGMEPAANKFTLRLEK